MLRALFQNSILLVALVVGAVVGGMCAPLLESGRGAYGPGVLVADSIIAGVFGAAIVVVVATGLGIVVGRCTNAAVGMFVYGGTLFGLAWRVAPVSELPFVGSLGRSAVETVLWAVVVTASSIAIFAFVGPLRDIHPDEEGVRPHPFRGRRAVLSALAGVAILPFIFIIAQTPAKGQVLGAVFVGATAAGLAGRLISPHVQPILLFGSPILFGAIGMLIAAFTGPDDLTLAVFRHEIPALGRPMPLDYAAVTPMGVAFGLGWAKSFLAHDDGIEHQVPTARGNPA